MRTWPLAATALIGSVSPAQNVQLTPLLDARVRWEQVDQADISRKAEAVTARIRSGVRADAGPIQMLVESEATLALAQHYNSGTNDFLQYPMVIDPQNIELNRAQIRYQAHKFSTTAGRQLLEMADQRFVGSASFRQNEQTFDAARVQFEDANKLFVDVVYAWSARTVNGIDGRGTRQQAVSGDNFFAMAGVTTVVGTASVFGYIIDQDEAVVQSFRLSNQTYGIRLAGNRPVGSQIGISYIASWARQSDWHRNPNHYKADYWLLEATANIGPLALSGGHEVLGASNGLALTSVQTPLASLFKFQGWADKFTTTPPNGIRDLYGTAGIGWKKTGPLDASGLSATYHRFRSDRLAQAYGTELDLLASVKRGRATFSTRLAHYKADRFATDTDKLWVQVDWLL